MTPRERVFTALSLQEPDMVPLGELVIDPLIVERIAGRTLDGWLGGSLVVSESEASLKANILNIVEAFERLDMDLVTLHWYFMRPLCWKPRLLEEEIIMDEWGAKWYIGHGSRAGLYAGGAIMNPSDLESFEKPDPYANGQIEAVTIAVQTLKRRLGDHRAVAIQIHDCFTRSWMRRGMNNFFIDLYTNPSFAERLMDEQLDYFLEVGKAAIDSGVDIVFSGDDYGDNKGPFMRPAYFKRFISPRLKRFVSILKKHGAQFVVKHCDGNMTLVMDQFIEAGFDGFHPLELMDLVEAKKMYGQKICLIGRVDNKYILPFGTEKDVEEEVRASIRALALGGGHILQSSNSLHSECKIENCLAMVRAARRYGRYPISDQLLKK